MSNPSSTEQEYTYVDNTNIPKKTDDRKTVPVGFNSNGAVYHILKQPGEPSDDYNYPDNTNIANQPSSEMEYTYARDTDIPRVTTDKKAGPKSLQVMQCIIR